MQLVYTGVYDEETGLRRVLNCWGDFADPPPLFLLTVGTPPGGREGGALRAHSFRTALRSGI